MSSTHPDAREVADALHSAAIHLLRSVRRVDETSGLTAARLSALSVLVFGGPTTVGRLASAEQVSAPTMSRLVQALEREGLVVREADVDDARAVRVTATAEGGRLLQQGRARRIDELVKLLEPLSQDELATLAGAAAMIEAFSAFRRPPPERMLRIPRKGGGPV